jgi:hypothetical protein
MHGKGILNYPQILVVRPDQRRQMFSAANYP